MTLFATIVSFALGVWLSIRALAALYAIVDLWPTIRTAWPRVARGIGGWGAIIVALSWRLDGSRVSAFKWGLLSYVLFYLSLFPLRDIALRVLRRRVG